MAPSPAARRWIVATGVTLALVQGVALLAWWKLPVWAPVWVARHSPWPGPVLRALAATDGAVSEEVEDLFHRRLLTWGPRVGPLLRDDFVSGHPLDNQELILLLLAGVVDEEEWKDIEPLSATASTPAAMRALRAHIHDDLVVVIGQGVVERDVGVRLRSIELACLLRDPRLVPILCRALADGPAAWDLIDQRIFAALRHQADRRAVPFLLAYAIRAEVALEDEVIAACLPVGASEEALAALAGDEPRLRLWALDHLAASGAAADETRAPSPAVVAAVLAAFADPVRPVRLAAITAAGALRLAAAIAPLSRLLRDSHDLTRVEAARALGVLGDPAQVPALLPLLDDIDGEVRRATAQALGRLGDPRVAEGLLRLTSDEDPAVALAALEALARLPLTPPQRQRALAARAELLPEPLVPVSGASRRAAAATGSGP